LKKSGDQPIAVEDKTSDAVEPANLAKEAINAARTFLTVSSFLPLNFRILAVSFMACHHAGCAVSITLCAFQILLREKPREQVATDHDNHTGNYEE